MNPSTSLGTRSKVGMAKPSPPIRQAGNIGHLLGIRGGCRRSLRSACAHCKWRGRCRANLDFFIADLTTWNLKDDQASMEHPMFSLAKSPDTSIRRYEHNSNTITIIPSVVGMPTIWDKDILIYCCSQLIEGIKQGREPKQIVRLTAYDLLVCTNRSTGQRGYNLLKQAFQRLQGVSITTNITTGGVRVNKGFGLIEWWEIIEKLPIDSRMVRVEVKLSDWLYRAVTNLEVLTLHRDYFRLDGGIERRLYELCRKHCGA